MKRAVVAVVLAACGGGGGGSAEPAEPTPPRQTCDTAADRFGATVEIDAASRDAAVRAFAESCAADLWSVSVIACFTDAADADALQACDAQLTDMQGERLDQRLVAVMGVEPDEPVEPVEPLEIDPSLYEPTGADECDALVKRTLCMWQQYPTSADVLAMFTDGVGYWREALQDDATRQATIDACAMSLEAGDDGFSAVGC